jgi:hypothetical protein
VLRHIWNWVQIKRRYLKINEPNYEAQRHHTLFSIQYLLQHASITIVISRLIPEYCKGRTLTCDWHINVRKWLTEVSGKQSTLYQTSIKQWHTLLCLLISLIFYTGLNTNKHISYICIYVYLCINGLCTKWS